MKRPVETVLRIVLIAIFLFNAVVPSADVLAAPARDVEVNKEKVKRKNESEATQGERNTLKDVNTFFSMQRPGLSLQQARQVEAGTGSSINAVTDLAPISGIDDLNTVSLLHFDGNDGSTTFTDESGKTWTAFGNAQIKSTQSKFGGASGYFNGSPDYPAIPNLKKAVKIW